MENTTAFCGSPEMPPLWPGTCLSCLLWSLCPIPSPSAHYVENATCFCIDGFAGLGLGFWPWGWDFRADDVNGFRLLPLFIVWVFQHNIVEVLRPSALPHPHSDNPTSIPQKGLVTKIQESQMTAPWHSTWCPPPLSSGFQKENPPHTFFWIS